MNGGWKLQTIFTVDPFLAVITFVWSNSNAGGSAFFRKRTVDLNFDLLSVNWLVEVLGYCAMISINKSNSINKWLGLEKFLDESIHSNSYFEIL